MGNRHLVAALGGSGGGSVVGKLGGAGAGLALGPTLRVAVSVPYHLRRHAGIAHVSINEVACYRTERRHCWWYLGQPLRNPRLPTRVPELPKKRSG